MYIEACESGSIFEGTLDDSLKIYAVVRSSSHAVIAPCACLTMQLLVTLGRAGRVTAQKVMPGSANAA